jgi:hypothetical protein
MPSSRTPPLFSQHLDEPEETAPRGGATVWLRDRLNEAISFIESARLAGYCPKVSATCEGPFGEFLEAPFDEGCKNPAFVPALQGLGLWYQENASSPMSVCSGTTEAGL